VSFTFVHTADLHLDSPFVGLATVSPELARLLRNATFQAFDRVVDLAIEERARFLLVAGDVYDGADRSLRAQLRFRDSLARAADHGIASYVAHGNHDPLSGWEADLTMPGLVHRFGGKEAEAVEVREGGETLARLYGISHAVRELKDNLADRFPRVASGPFAIGVLHANVGGNPDHDNYAPCTPADLLAVGLDYWALGHVHTRQVLKERAPAIVYPGNPQGLNWREQGARGCYLVRVDDGGEVHLTFAATDVVRWWRRQVDIRELNTHDTLLEALQTLREEVRRDSEPRGALLQIRLTGRGAAHRLCRREGIIRDLLQALQDGEADRSDFVWVDRLEDATRPPVDTAQRRTFRDFLGDFLKAAAELRTGPDPAAALRRILAEQPAFKVVAEEIAELTDDKLLVLLDDAETQGLDLLAEEE